MKTLLSIDLDYFGNSMFPFRTKKTISKIRNEYAQLFEAVSDFRKKGVEIFLVQSHDEILDVFDDYKVDKLINIDYHSDTFDEGRTEDEPNPATWVNFYSYKDACEYEWRYPCFADCIQEKKGLIECRCTFSWEQGHKIYNGFKKNVRKCGLDNLNFGEVQAIGIATSWDTNKKDYDGKFSSIPILEKFIDEYFYLFDDEISIDIIKELRAFINENKEKIKSWD